jgi:hypothetical protein
MDVMYDTNNSEIIPMFDITHIHFYFMKYVTNYKIYIKVVATEELKKYEQLNF